MSQTESKYYLIPEELAQGVLNYLAEQPYKDVANLVAGFSRLRPYEPTEDKEKKDGTNTKERKSN